MIIEISVAEDTFIITVDEVTTLTKNREDIYCRVSPSDSTVVEIWETTPTESARNVIFSSVFSNFVTPSGASASAVCTGINTILRSTPSAGTYLEILNNLSDVASADTAFFNIGFSSWKLKFRNLANTFTSFLTNAGTASRTFLFPDRDITVAGLDDIRIPILIGNTNHNPGDGATYYSGSGMTAVTSVDGDRNFEVIGNWTVTDVVISFDVTTTLASAQTASVYFRINGVDTTLTTTQLLTANHNESKFTGLSTNLTDGDNLQGKVLHPTYTINPTAVTFTMTMWIKRRL